jgi:hypothetical protein
LGKTLGSTLAPSCDELRDERWSCVAAEAGDERRMYELAVDDWGCWEARRSGAAGVGGEAAQEACISVRDFVDIETEGS